jgi:hypothetical protein
VNELAIQAHEKGELDHNTFHTISTDADCSEIKTVKRSRVNNDLVVELAIGEEKVEYLQPGDRPKSSLATTMEDSLGTHLIIQSSLLLTMNGMAHITDIKRLVQESDDITVIRTFRFFVFCLTVKAIETNVSDLVGRKPFDLKPV